MPRGKKNKRKNNQDVLTAKLMKISLTMDDHIYCGKRVSVTDAEGYLQEIASLKLKCPTTNVRALQVIEKLTRYMKTIIIEDQSLADHSTERTDQAYREIPEVCSPIYSLPDEDRTELYTAASMMDDTPIIDLTVHEEDKTNASQEQENLIENVNNTISNMAIQDQAQPLDEDYSQSILETFQNDTVCNTEPFMSKVIGIEKNSPQYTTFAPQKLVKDCSQSVSDILYNENTICIEPNKEFEDRNVSKSNLETNPQFEKEISNTTSNDTFAATNSLYDVEAQSFLKKDPSNKVEFINENALKSVAKPLARGSKEVKKEKKKIVRRKKNKDNTVTKKRKSPYKTDNTTKTRNEEKNVNRGNKARNIVIGKQAIRSDISVNKPETIYNKNVENDLSWVENLRYVREISPDDNDPTLVILEDNFWDNFSLPQKWNDLDFET